MIEGQISPESIDLSWLPILGQGMWSTVWDLEDGTVLKLSRRTAGLGDGVAKVKREIVAKTL